MQKSTLSISQLSLRSGLSAHTLRFYERAGILRPVARIPNGHRCYSEQDILWLEFVMRLKSTSMPLVKIKRYADLRSRGESTLQSRLLMLEEYQQKLRDEIATLMQCSEVLTQKVKTYKQQIARSKAANRRLPK